MQQRPSVGKAEAYIANLTKEANRLAQHAGRKTIKEEDVDLAVKWIKP